MNTQKVNQYFLSWAPELRDPRLWVEQFFDVVSFAMRLLNRFVFAAPVACFWFVIGLLWTHPIPFGAQAVSMVFEAVKDPSFWSLTFTLTVIYCFAVSSSLGVPFTTTFGRARHERLQNCIST